MDNRRGRQSGRQTGRSGVPIRSGLSQGRPDGRTAARRRIKKGRLTLLVLAAAVLVAGIVGLVVMLKGPSQKAAGSGKRAVFGVSSITVEGLTRYEQQDVIDRSGFYIGQSLLTVKKKQAAENLIAAFPYIRGVVVDSPSFGHLRIRVTEETPIAMVGVSVRLQLSPQPHIWLYEGTRLKSEGCREMLTDGAENGLVLRPAGIREGQLAQQWELVPVAQEDGGTADAAAVYIKNKETGRLAAATAAGTLVMEEQNAGSDYQIWLRRQAGPADGVTFVNKGLGDGRYLSAANDWMVVSDTGRAVQQVAADAVSEDMAGYIRMFTGAFSDDPSLGKTLLPERQFGNLEALLAAFEAYELTNIREIDMVSLIDIRLDWNGAVAILIGNDTDLDNAVHKTAAALDHLLRDPTEELRGQLNMRLYSDPGVSDPKAIFSRDQTGAAAPEASTPEASGS